MPFISARARSSEIIAGLCTRILFPFSHERPRVQHKDTDVSLISYAANNETSVHACYYRTYFMGERKRQRQTGTRLVRSDCSFYVTIISRGGQTSSHRRSLDISTCGNNVSYAVDRDRREASQSGRFRPNISDRELVHEISRAKSNAHARGELDLEHEFYEWRERWSRKSLSFDRPR